MDASMKHCSSIWQDHKFIRPVEINKLSPMTWKQDNRWHWRDLPSIMDEGLRYPILYYKVSEEWWNTKFAKWKQHTPMWPHINPPIVIDGWIFAVKMGTNRLRALKYMHYDTVDSICFYNSDDLVKLGVYLRDEDPVKNV